MSTTVQRRPLTAIIATQLRTVQVNGADVLVGVGSMPEGSGWGTKSPNDPTGTFTPYLVLTTVTAVPSADAGSVAGPQQDWHMPYLIQSFGVTHDQTEWMADKTRDALAALRNEILDLVDAKYRVQQVWTSSIGGVNRVPQSDPAFFSQQDGVTLWIAKRRTS